MDGSQKIKVEISYSLAIPLQDIYKKDESAHIRRTDISATISSAFTLAKVQKQHRCPQTDEQVFKRGNIHNEIPTTKKNFYIIFQENGLG